MGLARGFRGINGESSLQSSAIRLKAPKPREEVGGSSHSPRALGNAGDRTLVYTRLFIDCVGQWARNVVVRFNNLQEIAKVSFVEIKRFNFTGFRVEDIAIGQTWNPQIADVVSILASYSHLYEINLGVLAN